MKSLGGGGSERSRRRGAPVVASATAVAFCQYQNRIGVMVGAGNAISSVMAIGLPR